MILYMQGYFKVIGGYLSLKLEFVSDVSKDVAQIFFAVLAVESFTREIISWKLVAIGVLLSAMWWIVGIITFQIKK